MISHHCHCPIWPNLVIRIIDWPLKVPLLTMILMDEAGAHSHFVCHIFYDTLFLLAQVIKSLQAVS